MLIKEMTYRQWLIGMAMNAMMSRGFDELTMKCPKHMQVGEYVALNSFAVADAVLKRLYNEKA